MTTPSATCSLPTRSADIPKCASSAEAWGRGWPGCGGAHVALGRRGRPACQESLMGRETPSQPGHAVDTCFLGRRGLCLPRWGGTGVRAPRAQGSPAAVREVPIPPRRSGSAVLFLPPPCVHQCPVGGPLAEGFRPCGSCTWRSQSPSLGCPAGDCPPPSPGADDVPLWLPVLLGP